MKSAKISQLVALIVILATVAFLAIVGNGDAQTAIIGGFGGVLGFLFANTSNANKEQQ